MVAYQRASSQKGNKRTMYISAEQFFCDDTVTELELVGMFQSSLPCEQMDRTEKSPTIEACTSVWSSELRMQQIGIIAQLAHNIPGRLPWPMHALFPIGAAYV